MVRFDFSASDRPNEVDHVDIDGQDAIQVAVRRRRHGAFTALGNIDWLDGATARCSRARRPSRFRPAVSRRRHACPVQRQRVRRGRRLLLIDNVEVRAVDDRRNPATDNFTAFPGGGTGWLAPWTLAGTNVDTLGPRRRRHPPPTSRRRDAAASHASPSTSASSTAGGRCSRILTLNLTTQRRRRRRLPARRSLGERRDLHDAGELRRRHRRQCGFPQLRSHAVHLGHDDDPLPRRRALDDTATVLRRQRQHRHRRPDAASPRTTSRRARRTCVDGVPSVAHPAGRQLRAGAGRVDDRDLPGRRERPGAAHAGSSTRSSPRPFESTQRVHATVIDPISPGRPDRRPRLARRRPRRRAGHRRAGALGRHRGAAERHLHAGRRTARPRSPTSTATTCSTG